MNENLNLVEILKDCPKGTKLYSTIYGEVELIEVIYVDDVIYPIIVKIYGGKTDGFTSDGKLLNTFEGECTLFPSREQRDWSKFKVKKPKFDPKTLKAFDKVLARVSVHQRWIGTTFSHISEEDGIYKYVTATCFYAYCIPYNDDTKHLVGTTEEAPEYYRYWED